MIILLMSKKVVIYMELEFTLKKNIFHNFYGLIKTRIEDWFFPFLVQILKKDLGKLEFLF